MGQGFTTILSLRPSGGREALKPVLRLWHSGRAPAFQAGYGGSIPSRRSQLRIDNYKRGYSSTEERLSCKQDIGVRFPVSPQCLDSSVGRAPQ